MSDHTIRSLAWIGYVAAEVDVSLLEMFQALTAASADCPEAGTAADQLNQLRYAVRAVVAAVDELVAAAIPPLKKARRVREGA